MSVILTSVARLRAGLATIAEITSGATRAQIKVVARPQAATRPYKVHIPPRVRRHVYDFLAQNPQFPQLSHDAESITMTYAQAEEVIRISCEAVEAGAVG